MVEILEDKPSKILIVDDQSFNIEALKIILNIICKIDINHNVDIAMSG